MVCDANKVLNARSDCLIVSVGSNGDVSFEEAMRGFNSACEVHIYDPYLTAEKAARIPSWAQFFPKAFNSTTALSPLYKGRSISILKIDCEGCEFDGIPSWLESTCTDLVIPEVHGCRYDATDPILPRMQLFHKLMSKLEEHDFLVYSAESNLLAKEPGLCVEYGMQRKTTCPENARR